MAQAVFKILVLSASRSGRGDRGGLNTCDLGKLVARKKVVPGNPSASRLFSASTMAPCRRRRRSPPDRRLDRRGPGVDRCRRPAGTSAEQARRSRPPTSTTWSSRIWRRLTVLLAASKRYFTLAPLHNAGLSNEELQTYRNALNKLVNSLSWGSRIVNPAPIDPAKTVFRIDLRCCTSGMRRSGTVSCRNTLTASWKTRPARDRDV